MQINQHSVTVGAVNHKALFGNYHGVSLASQDISGLGNAQVRTFIEMLNNPAGSRVAALHE